MSEVPAKLKVRGKDYEILVDLDSALKVKKGSGDVGQALVTEAIFHNLKNGDRAGASDLKDAFGTEDINVVAEKIIKSGELELPTEYVNKERQERVKQIIDFLIRNAVDPRTNNPYTPTRIEDALNQAGVNIENKPIESQIGRVLEKLKSIIPIKIESKKLKATIPAVQTGKVYGLIKEYKESEEWLSNGDLIAIINIPVGMQMDFYDKLNSITHGSAVVEEIKE